MKCLWLLTWRFTPRDKDKGFWNPTELLQISKEEVLGNKGKMGGFTVTGKDKQQSTQSVKEVVKEYDWREPKEKEMSRSKKQGDRQTDNFRQWLDLRLIPGDGLRMRVKGQWGWLQLDCRDRYRGVCGYSLAFLSFSITEALNFSCGNTVKSSLWCR